MSDVLEGWLVEPLPERGYARRPHYFEMGEDRSICGFSLRVAKMLDFDTRTGRTLQPDPRLGEPQFRRECRSCWNELLLKAEDYSA